ncbi:aminodeoxychorismate/anthranilate synthase component II [Sphingomonas ginkgonis]|uniref:Aminodeoxychorismate/anthranilate synthase component II n=2 Tax=Sphingomonas ginkgonis TaxID=2315330 RepID=A0A429VDT4_9SPHN|nr:aminodeoxychorismate/anthranilate synthase component II [Sphingomonas ginkgonis]
MLVDQLLSLGAEVPVVRNDALSVAAALSSDADALLVSPGPAGPEDAGISVPLAAACIAARRPLLGVCLGHQAIALAAGGSVERTLPVHGKTAAVAHDGSGLFERLPSPLTMTRYHSLAVAVPGPDLVANAHSEDGTIMGLRHPAAPVHGVQFHPESVASEQGRDLLENFLRLAA